MSPASGCMAYSGRVAGWAAVSERPVGRAVMSGQAAGYVATVAGWVVSGRVAAGWAAMVNERAAVSGGRVAAGGGGDERTVGHWLTSGHRLTSSYSVGASGRRVAAEKLRHGRQGTHSGAVEQCQAMGKQLASGWRLVSGRQQASEQRRQAREQRLVDKLKAT
uniref:Uncharacterized protein n=1 Tax=Plectus sambesii TaxID=2011161 RepID=A0A914V0W5_9BILA